MLKHIFMVGHIATLEVNIGVEMSVLVIMRFES